VALDYDVEEHIAGIFISENRLENNVRGIQLWGNYYDPYSDVAGITINNNIILTDGSVMADKFYNFDGTGATNKVLSGIETNEGVTTAYKDLKILNNSITFKNTFFGNKDVTDKPFLSIVSPGISIWADADMEDITISQNHIEGCCGNGIKLGLRTDTTNKSIKNIMVKDNVVKNCGRIVDETDQYRAYILLGHGNKERITFSGNILEKTDTDFNVWASFYN
jgi:hypothetical protein